MKKKLFNTIPHFVLLIASIIAAGCNKTENHMPMHTSNVTHTACKNNKVRTADGVFPTSGTTEGSKTAYDEAVEETLHLKAIGRDVLQVIHRDVIFNCCPGTLSADCHIDKQTIFVTEQESENACRCICPYDLSYAISPLQSIKYNLQIKGYLPVSFRFSDDLDITFVLKKSDI